MSLVSTNTEEVSNIAFEDKVHYDWSRLVWQICFNALRNAIFAFTMLVYCNKFKYSDAFTFRNWVFHQRRSANILAFSFCYTLTREIVELFVFRTFFSINKCIDFYICFLINFSFFSCFRRLRFIMLIVHSLLTLSILLLILLFKLYGIFICRLLSRRGISIG